jgi:hypothetical protein
MKYQKPEVVLSETAITAIQSGFNKIFGDEDRPMTQSIAAYRSDE